MKFKVSVKISHIGSLKTAVHLQISLILFIDCLAGKIGVPYNFLKCLLIFHRLPLIFFTLFFLAQQIFANPSDEQSFPVAGNSHSSGLAMHHIRIWRRPVGRTSKCLHNSFADHQPLFFLKKKNEMSQVLRIGHGSRKKPF
jgi:hypothetical protein